VGEERSFLRAEHHESQLRGFVRPKSLLMPLDGAEDPEEDETETGEKGLSHGQENAGEEKEETREGDLSDDMSGKSAARRDLPCRPAPADKEEKASSDGREEEGEEGRAVPTARAPQRVSRQEREDHEKTHTPFRAWCSHCVRGRGRNTPHRTQVKDEATRPVVPRVSMDYFFMSEEDRKACQNPIFAMVDEETGEKYARAVGRKGLGTEGEMDWLIKDVSAELKAWGHSGGDGVSLILKSDGERAIVAVREAVAKYHGGRVIPEAPAKGESPSNGTVEEAGKTAREFTRVLRYQLESKAGMEIKVDDIIVLWMIRWAAMMCSRYLIGKDGRTAYERRRGRRCKLHVVAFGETVVAFGETVWYRRIRTSKDRKDKFSTEWEEGLWLGHARNSNEHIIGTGEGVIRAYAIRRQDEEHRWSADRIRTMQGTPQQPDPSTGSIHIPVRVRFDPGQPGEPIPSQLPKKEPGRRMRISEKLLEKYGDTEGCEGCRFKMAGMDDKRPHDEKCRQRVEAAMDQDDEGRELKKKDFERQGHRLAEEMERELEKAEELTAPDATQLTTDEQLPQDAPDAVLEEPTVGVEESAVTEQLSSPAPKRSLEDEEQQDAKRARSEAAPQGPDEEQLGETDITMEIRKLSVEMIEIYSPQSSESDRAGSKRRLGGWRSHGPDNRMGLQETERL